MVLITGTPQVNVGTGCLDLLERLSAVDGFHGDNFGLSVSASGQFVVVGAPSPTLPGSAHVFRVDGNGSDFVLLDTIGCPTSTDVDRFGQAVAVTAAGLLVVGASELSLGASNTGGAMIFTISSDGDVTFDSFLPSGLLALQGCVVTCCDLRCAGRWSRGVRLSCEFVD